MKTFGLHHLQDYLTYKEQLSSGDYPYREYHKGSLVTIECNDYKWQYKKSDDKIKLGSQGYHLCKLVKASVEKNLEEKQDFDYKRLNSLIAHEELFNPVALSSHIKQDMYSIDIDDCYWTTLYKLGYIDFFLYIKALQKKAWKQGRNASIGSLAAKERIIDFVGNKQVGDVVTLYPDEKLCAVRNHVIYSVWEIFSYIIQTLQDDFLMFFKDCVYVKNIKAKDLVVSYLHTKGHKCKIRHHYLQSFNADPKKHPNLAEWLCYEDNIKENSDNKLKFYQFVEDQNVKQVITE